MARRVLLIVGVGVVALLVAADFGARIVAEHMVATAAADSLHTSQRPDVSLGGWPFLPRFFAGHLPSATIHASGLTEGGVTLTSGELTLEDLHFSPSDVIRGGGAVSADTG